MTKPKIKQLYNPYTPVIYQIEKVRNRTRKALVEEYMIFLINLYGHLIEDGSKRITDYDTMTMLDIRAEVQLRTRAMRGSTNAKIRSQREKEQKKQDELLAKLARLK